MNNDIDQISKIYDSHIINENYSISKNTNIQ